MYVLEAYSAGIDYLPPGSPLEKAAQAEIRRACNGWPRTNSAAG